MKEISEMFALGAISLNQWYEEVTSLPFSQQIEAMRIAVRMSDSYEQYIELMKQG